MSDESPAIRGWWITLAVVAIAIVALLMRVPHLDRRPMHTDESNNTIVFRNLLDGTYQYNPADGHGPGLFYATRIVHVLVGQPDFVDTKEKMYRAVPLIFGIGLILLLIPLRTGLGPAGTVTAALLMAGSPAMVYYSRYFIHEVPYVFTIALTAVFLWMLASRRPFFGLPNSHYGWAPMVGLGMALMFTMKETCVIAWAGMGLGVLAGWLSVSRKQEHPRISGRQLMIYGAASVFVFLIAWMALISNFFSQPQGIRDVLTSYGNYAHRAAGSQGHDHPWNQYLTWMTTAKFPFKPVTGWWGESAILLLSVVGLIAAIIGRVGAASVPFARAVAAYTVFSVVVYFIIPYKTPWNMLPLVWGMILLGGVGISAIMPLLSRWWARAVLGTAMVALGAAVCYWTKWQPVVMIPTAMLALGMGMWAIFQPRLLLIVLVMIVAGHLGYQAWFITGMSMRDSGRNVLEVHRENPYVYAHTRTDVYKLLDRIDRIAAVTDSPTQMPIRVIAPPVYYWPLPWYLRRYSELNLSPLDEDHPLDGMPPFIIAEPSQVEALNEQLDTSRYISESYGLRPNVFLKAFIREDLWNEMLEAQHSGD